MSGLGWTFEAVGMPWWAAVPLCAAAGWLALRLLRSEASALPPRARAALLTVRGVTVAALGLLLLEPTVSHGTVSVERPAVAVLVDASGSMGAADPRMAALHRLDEAIALGLVPPEVRPDPWRRAAAAAEALDRDLDALIAVAEGGNDRPARVARHRTTLAGLALELAGSPEFANHLAALDQLLARLAAPGPRDERLAADISAVRSRLREIATKLAAAQAASDAALAAGAPDDSPIARGLAQLAPMPRLARATGLLDRSVLPALDGRADTDVLALADGAPELAAVRGASGATDFAGALSHLAREWPRGGARKPGAVLILSDGRQTASGDAVPAVRTLASRGARVWCVRIGDPDSPRDAAVAELRGPQEVFRGETVRLEARLRIAGFGDDVWDLVLERDGAEVDRRPVRGTGSWQIERFDRRDDAPGLHTWRARLERPAGAGGAVRPGGGLWREVWSGVAGAAAADAATAAGGGSPAEAVAVPDAKIVDAREHYAERLRGWVVPPVSGAYVFWLTADDGAELRLAPGADPASATAIASVPDHAPPEVWDKYGSQRSAPIELEAGRPYYLEALHQQNLGAAHLIVGWQLPDNRLERPIPGARLVPWNASGTPPAAVGPGGEAQASVANDHASCTVAVVDDPLRVLLVDAEPRWDARYLATLLERDPRSRVDRRYRSVRLARGERDLLPPTQEALDAYDAVILGDLAAADLAADDQEHLQRFVSARGGFVVLLSGPRGMPHSYGLGGIADLLPVRAGGDPAQARRAVGVALPDEAGAAASPITAVLDDPELNRRLWSALPPLQWAMPAAIPKPGAEVLLRAEDAARSPVVVAHRHGAGRVLWLGSDETWRWRDRLGERVHQAFWLQALRWGLGSRLRGRDPRLQVAIDRVLVEPGERVGLQARAQTAEGLVVREAPLARVRRVDGPADERVLDLRELPDAAGLFHAELSGLREGRWKVTIESRHAELAGVTETRELLVRPRSDAEGVELSADPAHLQRLAAAGGGRSGGPLELPALMREIAETLDPVYVPRRATWRLWGGHGVLIAIVALLTLDWWLRRRSGLV